MTENKNSCSRKDCFAYKKGTCLILKNTDFGEKKCCYFKDKATDREELIHRISSLMNENDMLISKNKELTDENERLRKEADGLIAAYEEAVKT
ncbi:MAG: hypothetical protein ACI4RU_00840 [Acutalibacteraceae bacterium]